MIDTELKKLAALATLATPGPWKADREGYDEVVRCGDGVVATLHRVRPDCERPNAAFLAACTPETIATLVAEVLELRKKNWKLVQDVSYLRNKDSDFDV